LELEEFFHESIEKKLLLELERNLIEDGRKSNSIKKTRDIFLETASKEPKQDLKRELLATKSKRSFGILTAKQASLVGAASHYWLDKGDGKLYKKIWEMTAYNWL